MSQHGFVRSALHTALLLVLGSLALRTQAQERPDLEQLQATTSALIETMVENGLLSREKADAMLAKARQKAEAQKAQQLAAGTQPDVGKDGKRVVRVPYVPESVKAEMRDQIKQEVLAQAKTERWGEPGALPSWMNRLKIEGDVRLRYDMTRLAKDNTAPISVYVKSGTYTRAPDMAPKTVDAAGVGVGNTQDDFDRVRVRARLGVTAALTDEVTGSIRLSTGNSATSANQSMGQSFSKYQVTVDQAYLTVKPIKDMLSFRGGRMPNPFFGTDLIWADDLGFEGVTGTFSSKALKVPFANNSQGFVTAGWFPITDSAAGNTRSRSMLGVQGGLEMNLGRSDNRLKLGMAMYDYRNMEGRKELTPKSQSLDPNYGTASEYQSGFRQRGNTLFRLNAANDGGSTSVYYGLASSFKEVALTASLDLVDLLPQRVNLTAEYVKNIGFDRQEIAKRTGVDLTDGGSQGFLARVTVGEPQITKRGQWNGSFAYRYLGSDAVLDAFTNSDFGLGGTNNKGFVLGFNYGLYDNTWLSMRWLSSNLIDPLAPGLKSKLSADALWFELNFRF